MAPAMKESEQQPVDLASQGVGPARLRTMVLLALVLALLVGLGWYYLHEPNTPPAPAGAQVAPVAPSAAEQVAGADSGGSSNRSVAPQQPDEPTALPTTHQLTVLAKTQDGAEVGEGVLHMTLLVAGKPRYLEQKLAAGKTVAVVPHGAVLSYAEVEPVEVRMSQFGWQAEDVKTSGFVGCDALEQWQEQADFEPKIEADRTLAVVVATGVEVSGQILDAVTGRGVAGAWVLVRDGSESIGSQSGDDGKFVVHGKVIDPDWDEELQLTAYHPRYRSGRLVMPLGDSKQRFAGLELRLVPGVRLSGSVVGHDGQPVAGATVTLMTERQEGKTFDRLGQVMTCDTDALGRFDLWGLKPAARAELVVNPSRYSQVDFRHGPFSLLSDQSGLVIAMPSMARVQLRPLLPGGVEVGYQQCVVVVAVAGEPHMTWNQLPGWITVPVGPSIQWTVIGWPKGQRDKAAFAVLQDQFAIAGDNLRTLQLQPLDSKSPWAVAEIEIGEKDKLVGDVSLNVKSRLVAHSFWFEFVDTNSGLPITKVGCTMTTAGGMSSTGLGDHGRARVTFSAGRHWCRVEVEDYQTKFFELRAPAGGSSRMRIELVRVP